MIHPKKSRRINQQRRYLDCSPSSLYHRSSNSRCVKNDIDYLSNNIIGESHSDSSYSRGYVTFPERRRCGHNAALQQPDSGAASVTDPDWERDAIRRERDLQPVPGEVTASAGADATGNAPPAGSSGDRLPVAAAGLLRSDVALRQRVRGVPHPVPRDLRRRAPNYGGRSRERFPEIAKRRRRA